MKAFIPWEIMVLYKINWRWRIPFYKYRLQKQSFHNTVVWFSVVNIASYSLIMCQIWCWYMIRCHGNEECCFSWFKNKDNKYELLGNDLATYIENLQVQIGRCVYCVLCVCCFWLPWIQISYIKSHYNLYQCVLLQTGGQLDFHTNI